MDRPLVLCVLLSLLRTKMKAWLSVQDQSTCPLCWWPPVLNPGTSDLQKASLSLWKCLAKVATLLFLMRYLWFVNYGHHYAWNGFHSIDLFSVQGLCWFCGPRLGKQAQTLFHRTWSKAYLFIYLLYLSCVCYQLDFMVRVNPMLTQLTKTITQAQHNCTALINTINKVLLVH